MNGSQEEGKNTTTASREGSKELNEFLLVDYLLSCFMIV